MDQKAGAGKKGPHGADVRENSATVAHWHILDAIASLASTTVSPALTDSFRFSLSFAFIGVCRSDRLKNWLHFFEGVVKIVLWVGLWVKHFDPKLFDIIFDLKFCPL